jgi:hypothetical protein
VNHLRGSLIYYSTYDVDCYWDRETGILVEESMTLYSPSEPESITIYLLMVETNIWSPAYAPVEVNINPDSLNLGSKGVFINCHINLPEGLKARDVDASSIMLNDTVPAEVISQAKGATHLVVKFDRAAVQRYILASFVASKHFATVTLTITGYLNDGTLFQGSETIKVISLVSAQACAMYWKAICLEKLGIAAE